MEQKKGWLFVVIVCSLMSIQDCESSNRKALRMEAMRKAALEEQVVQEKEEASILQKLNKSKIKAPSRRSSSSDLQEINSIVYYDSNNSRLQADLTRDNSSQSIRRVNSSPDSFGNSFSSTIIYDGSENSSINLTDTELVLLQKQERQKKLEQVQLIFEQLHLEYLVAFNDQSRLQEQLVVAEKKLDRIQRCHPTYKKTKSHVDLFDPQDSEDEVNSFDDQDRTIENIKFEARCNEGLQKKIEKKIKKAMENVNQLNKKVTLAKENVIEIRRKLDIAFLDKQRIEME